MKNKGFLLAEQVCASDTPLREIENLRKLLDRLEKTYTPRKRIYESIKKAWWKKRWVIRWRGRP